MHHRSATCSVAVISSTSSLEWVKWDIWAQTDSTLPVKQTEQVSSRNNEWVDLSFMKLLCFLNEMSSYPHLQSLYRILASLAITSTSAERAPSRMWVIKNRLRTSMVDDWFSSQTILAAESDVVHTLSTDEITNSFAQCSRCLRQHLL